MDIKIPKSTLKSVLNQFQTVNFFKMMSVHLASFNMFWMIKKDAINVIKPKIISHQNSIQLDVFQEFKTVNLIIYLKNVQLVSADMP